MEFLKGYTVKPYIIQGNGVVTFTDGTNNELMVNQPTCEAYGYRYDTTTGTCMAYNYNTNFPKNIDNINNKNNGSGNVYQTGSNTVQVNGTENTTRGYNTNCFINGSGNEIARRISNATVVGVGGKAESNGEFVIGGGLNSIPYGEAVA